MVRYRARKRNNPEQRIQLQILRYLKVIGATAGKTKTTGVANKFGQRFFDPYTFRGFPDLCVFWKHNLYFIEVKAEKGIQTPYQQTFELLCRDAGLPYLIARSLEDVERVIHP